MKIMRVKDLTVDELKILIKETVADTLLELIHQGELEQEAHLESKPAIPPQKVASSRKDKSQSFSEFPTSDSIDIPVKDVARDLGLLLD